MKITGFNPKVTLETFKQEMQSNPSEERQKELVFKALAVFKLEDLIVGLTKEQAITLAALKQQRDKQITEVIKGFRDLVDEKQELESECEPYKNAKSKFKTAQEILSKLSFELDTDRLLETVLPGDEHASLRSRLVTTKVQRATQGPYDSALMRRLEDLRFVLKASADIDYQVELDIMLSSSWDYSDEEIGSALKWIFKTNPEIDQEQLKSTLTRYGAVDNGNYDKYLVLLTKAIDDAKQESTVSYSEAKMKFVILKLRASLKGIYIENNEVTTEAIQSRLTSLVEGKEIFDIIDTLLPQAKQDADEYLLQREQEQLHQQQTLTEALSAYKSLKQECRSSNVEGYTKYRENRADVYKNLNELSLFCSKVELTTHAKNSIEASDKLESKLVIG